MTLNLFETNQVQDANQNMSDAFSNKALVPHFYILFVNLMIVLLFANSEINARVGSTCLFYYISLSQLVVETHNEM